MTLLGQHGRPCSWPLNVLLICGWVKGRLIYWTSCVRLETTTEQDLHPLLSRACFVFSPWRRVERLSPWQPVLIEIICIVGITNYLDVCWVPCRQRVAFATTTPVLCASVPLGCISDRRFRRGSTSKRYSSLFLTRRFFSNCRGRIRLLPYIFTYKSHLICVQDMLSVNTGILFVIDDMILHARSIIIIPIYALICIPQDVCSWQLCIPVFPLFMHLGMLFSC